MKYYTLQRSDSTPAVLLKILTPLQSLILHLLLKKKKKKHRLSSKSESEHKGKVKEVEKPPLESTDVSTSVPINLFQQHTAAERFIRGTQAVQIVKDDPEVPMEHIIKCKMNGRGKKTFDYVTIFGQLFIIVVLN